MLEVSQSYGCRDYTGNFSINKDQYTNDPTSLIKEQGRLTIKYIAMLSKTKIVREWVPP